HTVPSVFHSCQHTTSVLSPSFLFSFTPPAPTQIYTLSLHDALPISTVARQLSALRGFYRWMVDQQHMAENPAALIERPKTPQTLPSTLTEAEVEALLQAPDTEDPLGVRDKAMLEVLYASGLRVTELV